MIFRASSLGKLMTSSRTKGEALSQTAKSYIIELAKQNFYEYDSQVYVKQMYKGIEQEHESIQLLNSVRFKNYTKNEERMTANGLTGCCDIITDDSIIDIKSSFSLETFPATTFELKDLSLYEWQGRAYMWLYDKPTFELIYCMVSTHEDFMSPFDNKAIHQVDHIDPAKRITSITFERDYLVEAEISERLALCSEFYDQVLTQLENK